MSRNNDVQLPTGPSSTSRRLAVLGIVVLLAVSVVAAIWWKRHLEPSASPLTIEVTASPEGSEIFIDGVSAGISVARRELQAGKHDLLVSRSGYRPWQQSLEVAGSLKLPVKLEPIPMDLRIVPGQDKVEVWLDNESQVGALDGSGVWTLTGISEGTHSIRIKTAAGESTMSFDFRNGNPAAPSFPQGGPTILFVSGSGGNVRAECNCKAELQLGDSSQPLDQGSAATFTLAEGNHPAELKGLSGPKKVPAFTVGPTPAATMAFFWTAKEKPATDIQTLLNSSLNLLKDSKCDSAQANIDQVLSRAPDNVDALGIDRRITRLRSVGGCR
jgi:PEGA domain